MIFTTFATLLLPSLAQGRHTLKTEPMEAQFQVLVSGYNRARDRSSATTDRPLSLKLYDVDVEGRVYDAGAHVLETGEDNLTYMEIVKGDTIYAVHEVDSYMHVTGPGLSRWTLSLDGMQNHEFVKTRERPVSLSVSVELGVVFVANYGNDETETPENGSMQVFALDAEGVIGDLVHEQLYGEWSSGMHLDRPECFGHATDVVHKGNNFYVAERGCDRIHHYTVHDGVVRKRPILELTYQKRGGFGPRKITMHPTEDLAFVVTELRHPDDHLRRVDSLEVYAVNPEDGKWSFNQRLVLDETEVERSGAEVVMHPNGKYFYVSTSRISKTGVLDVYELPPDTREIVLSSIQRYELVGNSPRGLALSPDGSFIVVADEDFPVVQFVNVDPETGMLTTKRIYNTPETMGQTPTFVGIYSAPDFQPSTPYGEPSDESESEFPERPNPAPENTICVPKQGLDYAGTNSWDCVDNQDVLNCNDVPEPCRSGEGMMTYIVSAHYQQYLGTVPRWPPAGECNWNGFAELSVFRMQPDGTPVTPRHVLAECVAWTPPSRGNGAQTRTQSDGDEETKILGLPVNTFIIIIAVVSTLILGCCAVLLVCAYCGPSEDEEYFIPKERTRKKRHRRRRSSLSYDDHADARSEERHGRKLERARV